MAENPAAVDVLRIAQHLIRTRRWLSLADISGQLHLGKSRAHRLLGALVREGWAEAKAGRYRIGLAPVRAAIHCRDDLQRQYRELGADIAELTTPPTHHKDAPL